MDDFDAEFLSALERNILLYCNVKKSRKIIMSAFKARRGWESALFSLMSKGLLDKAQDVSTRTNTISEWWFTTELGRTYIYKLEQWKHEQDQGPKVL